MNCFELMDQYGAYVCFHCVKCGDPFMGFKRQFICYSCLAPADMPQEHRDAMSHLKRFAPKDGH